MNQQPVERFSMNNWKPPTAMDKKLKVEEDMNRLQQERNIVVFQKKRIETTLAELTNLVRAGRLKDEEYADICRQQNALKKEKLEVEEKLSDIKMQMREKNTEKERYVIQHQKEPNGIVKDKLALLRDKYMSFAADTTRVSSMRAMSSRFVEEIQEILKSIE